MPQRVAFWIYWQALKLVAKGCPLQPKPNSAQFQAALRSGVSGGAASSKGLGTGDGSCPVYVWREAQQWPWFL
jgi:hypothetical protein